MLDTRLLTAVVPQLTCLRLAHLAPICAAAWGQASTRWASTSSDQQKDVIVVPMPKLSPSMSEGTVSKWLKAPGDEVKEFDVVMEVDTEGLTEDAYKVGEFAGNVTLLVEAQEDGYLHSILVGEGKKVAVGTPVALMAELQESLSQLDQYQVPVSNIYQDSESSSPVRTLVWQSYLKSDEGGGSRGCD